MIDPVFYLNTVRQGYLTKTLLEATAMDPLVSEYRDGLVTLLALTKRVRLRYRHWCDWFGDESIIIFYMLHIVLLSKRNSYIHRSSATIACSYLFRVGHCKPNNQIKARTTASIAGCRK